MLKMRLLARRTRRHAASGTAMLGRRLNETDAAVTRTAALAAVAA